MLVREQGLRRVFHLFLFRAKDPSDSLVKPRDPLPRITLLIAKKKKKIRYSQLVILKSSYQAF